MKKSVSEQLPTGIRRKSKNSLEIRVKHNNKTYYGYAQTVVEAIRIKAELKAKLKTNNVNAISCNYDTGRNEAMKEDNKVRVDFSKLEKELELQNKSKSQLSYEIGRSSAYISGIKNGKIPRNIEALICKTLNRTPGYFVLKEEAASNDNAAELLKRIVESNSVIIEKLNVLSERVAIVEDMYEKAIKTESVLESNMEVVIQHSNAIRSKGNANTVQLENIKSTLNKMESFHKERLNELSANIKNMKKIR
nr:MAG TPA: LAMBDA REPRESSOR (TRIPLE MUTANT)/DNA COMPLEX-DNA COMPLEX, DOUBLE HELIX, TRANSCRIPTION-DNA.1A [Caudoviricetes sp.]